jgi:hypothetical protein
MASANFRRKPHFLGGEEHFRTTRYLIDNPTERRDFECTPGRPLDDTSSTASSCCGNRNEVSMRWLIPIVALGTLVGASATANAAAAPGPGITAVIPSTSQVEKVHRWHHHHHGFGGFGIYVGPRYGYYGGYSPYYYDDDYYYPRYRYRRYYRPRAYYHRRWHRHRHYW